MLYALASCQLAAISHDKLSKLSTKADKILLNILILIFPCGSVFWQLAVVPGALFAPVYVCMRAHTDTHTGLSASFLNKEGLSE